MWLSRLFGNLAAVNVALVLLHQGLARAAEANGGAKFPFEVQGDGQSIQNEQVVLLNQSFLDDFVKAHDHVLVKFCNPWSRHCKALEPAFAKVAESVHKHGLVAWLANVDTSTEGVLAERFSVTRLPSFRYFKHFKAGNVIVDYKGQQTHDALLKWLADHEDPSFDWHALLAPVVATLATNNFSKYLEEHDKVLVDFYSPWCRHCIALEPEYEAAATQLKKENRTTKLAKVNVLEERDLARLYGIHSYPTLKYFIRGVEGDGPDTRNANGIAKWLRNRETSRVELIASADIEGWVYGKQFAVIVTGSTATKRHSVYEKVASDFMDEADFSFAVAVPLNAADAPKRRTLVIHRRGFAMPDAEVVEFSGPWTRSNIRNWVWQMSYPSIGEYDHDPDKYTPKQGTESFLKVSMVVSLSKQDDADLMSKAEALLLKHVHALKAKHVQVAWADIRNRSNDEALSRRLEVVPQLTLLVARKGKSGTQKYVLRDQENFTNDTKLSDFMEQYFRGSLKPAFKSQSSQSIQPQSNSITTLVGDNFEQVAFAEKHDVFVKFYAPWCGQCQKLEAIWKEFAVTVQRNGFIKKGVIVAEMDSTLNECVEDVPAYPHLVLYPAVRGGERRKMREKVVYTSGKQDVPALLDFLEENAINLENVDTKLFADMSGSTGNNMKDVQNLAQLRGVEEADVEPSQGDAQCKTAGQKCSPASI